MELIPPVEEQEWLFEALRDLVSRRGVDPFVVAPIVEPTPKFFPDRWEPSADGVGALALRLLG
ncbi:MAG TPA: hypothetical protein VMV18_15730, partial [bacterium]|nr:hypothetical protein [bacterium]